MNSLVTLCNAISTATGRVLAWLVYAMMLISCLVVLLRYGFGISIIAMQESVTYLHACVFMLGAAYTLQQGEHVRVDILYRNFSARRKALVDLTGSILFLLPLCLFLLYSSQEYVSNAWAVRETSVEKDGIPAVFLLKSLIPMMAILLLIQAVAEIIKNLLVLRNND
ncbi:MAG: TRAP transporter small permease subunit [Pseudomonadales bacterium]